MYELVSAVGGGWRATEWSAAGTWVTALIAGLAAVFAGWQVWELRRTRDAEAQPFIVVTLQPAEQASNIIVLRIENIGHTLARDVRFTFTPPLHSIMTSGDTDDLAESRLVQEGLPTMPPGMRLERIFDNAIGWGDDGEKQPVLAYDVMVTFKDYRGKPQDPLTYVVDLRPYMDGSFLENRTIHHAAKALDDIRKELGKWSGSRGLNVWSRDGDAKDQREREWFEQRRAERQARAEAQEPADDA